MLQRINKTRLYKIYINSFSILALLFISVNSFSQNTPLKNNLYIAIENGNLSEVKSIIDSGYHINQVFELETDYNYHGYTPLIAACYAGSEDIACYLINKGADVNKKPNKKMLKHKRYMNLYAIDWAISHNMIKTTELLLENKANANHLIPQGNEYEGLSPLHIALSKGQNDIAKLLIKSGANVNLRGQEEMGNALHFLSFYNQDSELAALTLKNKGKINAKDRYGNTPLHIAVDWGASQDYVSFLLKNGANKKLKNKEGKTAYDIAVRYNKTEYIELLK